MALAGAVFLATGLRGRASLYLVLPGAALLGLGAWMGGLERAFFLAFTGLGFLPFALRTWEW